MAKNTRRNRKRAAKEWALRSARASEANAPRKHHVVPGSYLRRWEQDGALWVLDRASRRTFSTRANKIARETDFYRLDAEDVTDPDAVPPNLAEFLLSQLEGAAVAPIDALVEEVGVVEGFDDARFDVTNFVAMQMLRGRRARANHQSAVAGMNRFISTFAQTQDAVRAQSDRELNDEEVEQILDANRRLASGEIQLVPTQASSIALAFEMLPVFGEEIFARQWVRYLSEVPLLTTDEPVVALAGRNVERGSVPGPAIAGALLFPLDPHHLLAMFHADLSLSEAAAHPVLTATESAEVNLELAAHAHLHVMGQGGRTMQRVPSLPPPVASALVQSPVPVRNAAPGSEIIATFQPSPWLYAPRQPLPVERWWELDTRTFSWKRPDSPWAPSSGVYIKPDD